MMTKKFHGIDRHKHFSTISVLNREGQEVTFIGVCKDLKKYVENLGPADAVVQEASTGSRIRERHVLSWTPSSLRS